MSELKQEEIADASSPLDAERLVSTEFPPDEYPDPPQTTEDMGVTR